MTVQQETLERIGISRFLPSVAYTAARKAANKHVVYEKLFAYVASHISNTDYQAFVYDAACQAYLKQFAFQAYNETQKTD